MQATEISERIRNIFPNESEIPDKYRLERPHERCDWLVNGEIRYWEGKSQEVFSPVCIKNGETAEKKYLGRYPMLTGEESLESLDAAVRAWDSGRGTWPTMSVLERIAHVEDFVFRMEEKRNDIVKLLMWEIGKNLKDSEKEFDRTVEYIRDTIDALKELDRISSRFTIENGIVAQIRRAPLGVALCMGPFNYPLNETLTVLIPALIMGNSVVFKPPKLGVLFFSYLLEAFRDSFPPGVVNSVYGDGREVIPPIMESGKIDILAFIGTSAVADILRKQHPKPHRLRCVLGLEAKNPAIILADANLETAVSECVLGSLSFNGQRCTALKIIFVHSDIADEFVRRFSDAVSSLKIGMPWDEGAFVTPLPELNKAEWLTELVDDAKAQGAKTVNESGGEFNRTFFHPAVLYPVNSEMRVYYEEQFGPVIPILPFTDIDTPVKYMMESNYGQQISIFGRDSGKIAEMIDPMVNQVCRVNINSQCQRGPDTFPFTGRKDSAEGTLSVSDALRVFTIRTLVAAKGTDDNKRIIGEILRERKSKFLSTDFIL
ncbi:MAG TPA: NADP-dependent glyceraldehyde-3-phosphate dehydrogenase [Firmicutes bacterium]|nr:NADP-dependent glyceraldehyde-3-phosphate dehydrogenase [Bacillota bacterium]